MGLIAEYEITCQCLPLVTAATDVPEATLDIELQPNHGNRTPFIVHTGYRSYKMVPCECEGIQPLLGSFCASVTKAIRKR